MYSRLSSPKPPVTSYNWTPSEEAYKESGLWRWNVSNVLTNSNRTWAPTDGLGKTMGLPFSSSQDQHASSDQQKALRRANPATSCFEEKYLSYNGPENLEMERKRKLKGDRDWKGGRKGEGVERGRKLQGRGRAGFSRGREFASYKVFL